MDTSISTSAARRQPARKPKPQPLVRSVGALRAIVVGLTLLSLSGMTAYAGTHVQNSGAPLTAAAAAVVDASTSTAVAVAQTTTGTLTLSPSVQTTTAAATTTTHHS